MKATRRQHAASTAGHLEQVRSPRRALRSTFYPAPLASVCVMPLVGRGVVGTSLKQAALRSLIARVDGAPLVLAVLVRAHFPSPSTRPPLSSSVCSMNAVDPSDARSVAPPALRKRSKQTRIPCVIVISSSRRRLPIVPRAGHTDALIEPIAYDEPALGALCLSICSPFAAVGHLPDRLLSYGPGNAPHQPGWAGSREKVCSAWHGPARTPYLRLVEHGLPRARVRDLLSF